MTPPGASTTTACPNAARDFPFYAGHPHAVPGPQWLFVLAMLVLGFAVLAAGLPIFDSPAGRFVPALLLVVLPWWALNRVTHGHASALLARVRGLDLLWMLAFAALELVVSAGAALLVAEHFGASPNPAIETLSESSAIERAMFLLMTLPQLFGEELLTMLPLLALLQWLTRGVGLARRPAIVLAWIATSVLFGLAHLPTYDGNLAQCLLVIGTARLCLTLPYLLTKNLWVSFGTHVIADWAAFGIAILTTP